MSTPGNAGGGGGNGGGKKPHTHKVNHTDLWCTEDLVITNDGNRRIVEIKEHELGRSIAVIANEVDASGGTLEFWITYPAAGGGTLVDNAMCPC